MIRQSKLLIVILISVCVLMGAHASQCTASRQKLVVVVANRLLLSDLNDPTLPTISKMLKRGSVGLISPNCAGGKTEYSVLLTAGTGTSCRGGAFIRESYDADEVIGGTRAADAYTVRTGYHAKDGSAVLLGFAPALRANADAVSGSVTIGACGEALRKTGVKTCVVGNADITPDWIDRSAAVLAMDARGRVDVGELASLPNASVPFSNAGQLQKAVRAAVKRADYVVAYYGDSTRLDMSKMSLSDKAYAAHKADMLKNLDRMLADLIRLPESRNIKFILASFSPPDEGLWNQLTPIVVYPSKEPGLLTSSTTRTNGLIAASDFAPTVLGLMHTPAVNEMIGRPAQEVSSNRAVQLLQDMDMRVPASEKLITPVAWAFGMLAILCFTGASVSVAFRLRISKRILSMLRGGMLLLLCAPVSMYLAVLAPAGIVGYVLGTVVSMVGLAVVVALLSMHKTVYRAYPVLLAASVTVIVILIDAVSGCWLCKFNLLSSYQITAMRFYGIGNEYAGFLIPMAALVPLWISERCSPIVGKWLTVLVGIVTIAVLCVGSWGANYGATVAATVTFGLVGMSVWRGRFGVRHVVAFLLLGFTLVALSGFIDLRISGAAGSHIARTTGLTEKLGGNYLLTMADRKVLHNIYQTFSKHAVRAILAFVPFLVLWFWGVQGKVKQMFCDRKHMLAGLKGVMIGSAVAYLLNDSGIVFASIMIAMTVLILLYSLLEKPEVWLSPKSGLVEEVEACQES